MKLLPALICAVALIGASLSCLAQTTDVNALLTQAQRAAIAGKEAEAKLLFTRVLELQPNNQTAKRYLGTIVANERKTGAGGVLKAQLNTLKVDKIDFNDTSLDAVLQFLTNWTAQNTNGQVKLSFVQKLPPGFAQSKRVTLSLQSIPMSELLRYIGTLTDTTFKAEQYAVVVEPAAAPQAEASSSPTPDQAVIKGL